MFREADLVVFSHLRWDFVWQRPQHLLSRLARDRRVFFVEEPVPSDRPHCERIQAMANLTVLRPHSPVAAPGFHDDQMHVLRPLIQEMRKTEGIVRPVVWFYTPMALPLLEEMDAAAVVYDCMDDLASFKSAPPQMSERESELMRRADVVFTGGPSLYRARAGRHPNIHCFPSSVDATHFGTARLSLPEPADQAKTPHPRLGYFGVIDERIDLPLLDTITRTRPNWQFIMVGPVVKIDPASLPRYPNILYTGQKPYAELPAYLSGWDVALLPFARNEATRFISPTKTLEYMAAEKPIVSTPIADVAEPYGEIVYLGATAQEFLAGCERALRPPAKEAEARVAAMREVLERTSWDETAAAMSRLLGRAASLSRPQTSAATSKVSESSAEATAETIPVAIIGAGPTGLSAAYHLGEDAALIDQNERVGGWCRSVYQDGFTFDYAGHIMFSNDRYVHEMYQILLGDNVHWQDREAWIWSKGVYTRYPFQGALYGLPPEVIKECIVGAIESRYGTLKPAKANGNPTSNGTSKGSAKPVNGQPCPTTPTGDVKDCCGDGVMEATAKLSSAMNAPSATTPPANFEEFIYKVWGAGIAKHFAIPYNRKLWAVPLSEMETSWLGGRVPLPDLEDMIEGALRPVPKPMGPNARFGYPLRGGFQALMDGFLPHLRGPLMLGTRVVGVSPSRRMLTLSDGTQVAYEQLISTMPLPVLVRMIGSEAPEEVRQAAAGLRHISVRCVNIGVGRENLTEKHWIYYPEDTIFHRIFVQGNASPHCNPAGGFGLTCEITYHPTHKPLPCDGDELIQRCIDDCRRVGFFKDSDPVLTAGQVDMPHAYVVYDHARPKNVATIRDWLLSQDIILAGRYSEWEYYNSDHAFLAGKKAAEVARERLTAEAVAP